MSAQATADRNEALHQLSIVEGVELPLVAQAAGVRLHYAAGWVDGFDQGREAAHYYMPRHHDTTALEWYEIGRQDGGNYWYAMHREAEEAA